MTLQEWREAARAVNTDIAGMTRASLMQKGIREAIGWRQNNPTEEFFIDEDAFGSMPAAPRILDVDGTPVKVWKTHRAGLNCSDIRGADLYYEVADSAFILVQYKSPNRSNRISLDDKQLLKLQNCCPSDCPPSNRFTCGGWYAIRTNTIASYFPGCEARALFHGHKSRNARYFVNGLSRELFHKEFGSGRIGARARPIDIDAYKSMAIKEDRVIISALLET